MSISEDITVMEYMTPNDYDGVETVVTNETGKSNLIWVPWSAREHVGVLAVSHNGEYVAASKGLFGWTKVDVLVPGSEGAQMEAILANGTVIEKWVRAPASTIKDDIGYGSGAVIGEYGGVTYIVTLDEEGNLLWTQQEGDGSEEGGKVWVDENTMNAINEALKDKTGADDDYEFNEMPSAIRGIRVCTMTPADEGKVVHDGQLVAQTPLRVTENGTYDTVLHNEVTVTVQGGKSLNPSNLGFVVADTDRGYDLVEQTSRTITANGTYDTTTNNEVVAEVPNTYDQGDVGKMLVRDGDEYIFVPIYPAQEDGKVWVDADTIEAINDAIKAKTGETTDYDPDEMSDAIRGLASAILGTKSVTENGTYAATNDGYDGYSHVAVNVQSDEGQDDPTQEGKVWIDAEVLDEINEAIKGKTGATTDYDPEDMADAISGISTSPAARLVAKSIAANGTYNPSTEGYDGYSQVIVSVQSGDGYEFTAADVGKAVAIIPESYKTGEEDYTYAFPPLNGNYRNNATGASTSSTNATGKAATERGVDDPIITLTRGSGTESGAIVTVGPSVANRQYGYITTFDIVASSNASGPIGYMALPSHFAYLSNEQAEEFYQCDNLSNETMIKPVSVYVDGLSGASIYIGINLTGLAEGDTVTLTNIKCYEAEPDDVNYGLVEQTTRRIESDGTYDTTYNSSSNVMVGRRTQLRLKGLSSAGSNGTLESGGCLYNKNYRYTKGSYSGYTFMYITLGDAATSTNEYLTVGSAYYLHFIIQAEEATFDQSTAFGYEIDSHYPSDGYSGGREIVIQYTLEKDASAHEYFVKFTATAQEMNFSIDTTSLASGGKLFISDVYVLDQSAITS